MAKTNHRHQPLPHEFLIAALTWCQAPVTSYLRHLPGIRRFFVPTVQAQIALYSRGARERLLPKFKSRGVSYPPEKLSFIAIKSTKKLLVYAAETNKPYRYIASSPIYGASGHLSPKLKEGDRQVPEGIYELTLEPDTPYHVALRLNFPNISDLARAESDGRSNPGRDILIHGTTGFIGCIAVGHTASEDLFVAAFDTDDKHLPWLFCLLVLVSIW